MKTNSILKELMLWIIILIPLVYLGFVWDELPAQVPMHFNLAGEVDRWGDRQSLLWLVVLLTAGLNLLMLLIPKIDPKRKLEYMGSKYLQLRFIMVTFMAAIAGFIIYSSMHLERFQFSILLILLGAFFAVLGNYFQTIRPNYFIGIRTPWTLESESVWRKTHRLGGRLWIFGGLGLVLLALLPDTGLRQLLFVLILAVMVLVPLIYSYVASRKQQQLERHS